MLEPILVINAGSPSIKFSAFETAADRSLPSAVNGAAIGISSRLEVTDAQGHKLAAHAVARGDRETAIAAIHGWLATRIGREAGLRVHNSALPQFAPDRAEGKLVVAQLGNGASLRAIDRGRSIATPMGFTPVDGLMMGTRAGAIDPGVILYLLQHEHTARRQ